MNNKKCPICAKEYFINKWELICSNCHVYVNLNDKYCYHEFKNYGSLEIFEKYLKMKAFW